MLRIAEAILRTPRNFFVRGGSKGVALVLVSSRGKCTCKGGGLAASTLLKP